MGMETVLLRQAGYGLKTFMHTKEGKQIGKAVEKGTKKVGEVIAKAVMPWHFI